jgi:hypothetical protein
MYSVFPVRKRAFFIFRSYAKDGGGLLFKVFLLSVTVPVPTLTVYRSFTVRVLVYPSFYQMGTESSFPMINQPGHNHSLPFGIEFKNTFTPPHLFIVWS